MENNMFDNDNEEVCPSLSTFLGMLAVPKHLGILWPIEKMKWFLIQRGWKIIDRIDPDTGELMDVAVKGNEEFIPEEGNIVTVFNSEVEDILLNWLLNEGRKMDDLNTGS